MKIEFVGQPDGPQRTGDWLLNRLGESNWQNFWATVAFAKQSGTGHLTDALQKFATSRSVLLGVGIDHHGTSLEAVQDLVTAVGADNLFLCHHASLAHTFHPKAFLFADKKRATALVGSGNLTEGGLFTNYEAATAIQFDLTIASDKTAFTALRTAMTTWLNPAHGIARNASAALLAQLTSSGDLPTEVQMKAVLKQANAKPAGTTAATASPFGKPIIAKAPPRPNKKPQNVAGPTSVAAQTASAMLGELRWRKPNLAKSDAQQPKGKSSPTGVLRLSQSRFKVNGELISSARYFRNDVFGHLAWADSTPKKSVATAQFMLLNGKKPMGGPFTLMVSHQPSREAKQKNVTTVLHWGAASPIVRETNVLKRTLELYGPNDAGQFTIVFV
ncbi:phospholipase D family protein [Roseiterribacter gracilis]|uniref:Phospholipase D-like domain-containing protein n=1 Tax=Roseiterribacter gracilis TaxID=2812848 RepID=A0A8S8XHV8_9PROT|nr:hypothetical protein TMPK1_30320 [Rhodospirillales bacterium TMPK1]